MRENEGVVAVLMLQRLVFLVLKEGSVAMRQPIYDWDKIEQDFIHDNEPLHNGVTLKTIAEKYDVPYQTVRRKAAEGKWHRYRYWAWCNKKTPEGRRFMRGLDRKIARIEARYAAQLSRNSDTNTVKYCNRRDPQTGRFLSGNQAAVGNKGNRNPKWRNKNAFKHGLYANGRLIQALKDVGMLHRNKV